MNNYRVRRLVRRFLRKLTPNGILHLRLFVHVDAQQCHKLFRTAAYTGRLFRSVFFFFVFRVFLSNFMLTTINNCQLFQVMRDAWFLYVEHEDIVLRFNIDEYFFKFSSYI